MHDSSINYANMLTLYKDNSWYQGKKKYNRDMQRPLLKIFNKVDLKETPAQVFLCKFWKNFKNSFFLRTPLVAASILKKLPLSILIFSDENNIAKLAFICEEIVPIDCDTA